MPELPEVEQVKKTLSPHIINHIIEKTEVNLPRLIKYPDADTFCRQLCGRKIIAIERRGKYLTLVCDQNMRVVVHLRMTGALIVTEGDGAVPPPYAKIHFTLSGGMNLWFTDIRTFGSLHLITAGDIKLAGYDNLGPEPCSKEFTAEYLAAACKRHSGPIKGVILKQEIIAGLGNIYADEALFAAGILPNRPANTLTAEEIAALVQAVNAVITQGIKNRGTTFRDYKDGNGEQGMNQNYLAVYGKKGQPCKKCHTVLCGTKVAGRGTTYCPHCQH